MFDSETHYFDTHHDPSPPPPHSLPLGSNNQGGDNNNNNNTILSNPSYSSNNNNPNLNQSADESVVAAANTMDFELDQQQQVLVHDPSSVQNGAFDHSNNWEVHQQHQHQQEMQEMQDQLQAEQFYQQQLQNNLQCFNSNPFTQSSTPDLLNLLHLPRCGSGGASSSPASMLPNSSISFGNNPLNNFNASSLEIFGNGHNNDVIHGGENGSAGGSSTILYDHPSLHLNNLPPQPPIFRDLFQTLPQTYGLNGSGAGISSSSLFGGGIDIEREGSVYHHHHQDGDSNGMRSQFENSVLDFRRSKNININGAGGSSSTGGFRRASHGTKHFTTEKQRREQFNEKYKALSLLVPNPSKKQDRATVVQDAIEYIKELRRTVDELKILVDKKRFGSRNKKLKTEDEAAAAAAAGDMESSTMKPTLNGSTDRDQNSFNGPVRSSWLQRKSKETEVDVRIIDDDVTIKLIQRSQMNNLLLVSRIIDELGLDLLHVSGGSIGDHYSFWFNTKINEGSSVYASAIAKKLIEGVDKNYAASKPENNY